MSNHFRCLGFEVNSKEDFVNLMVHAAGQGKTYRAADGLCNRWACEGGIEIWSQATLEGGLLGCAPHFGGASRTHLAFLRFIPSSIPQLPMEGCLECQTRPAGAASTDAGLRVIFVAPEFGLLRPLVGEGAMIEVQLAAFPQFITCDVRPPEFISTWWSIGSQELPADAEGKSPPPLRPRRNRKWHSPLRSLTWSVVAIHGQAVNSATFGSTLPSANSM